MEIGLNDSVLGRRLLWGSLPVALALGRCVLSSFQRGPDLEGWVVPGSFSLAAALVALSPPTPWWRIHMLRMGTWLLCWPPLLLEHSLGLTLVVVLAPLVLMMMALSAEIEEDRV